jgi:mannan endo-1,4-beta-mannosidase
MKKTEIISVLIFLSMLLPVMGKGNNRYDNIRQYSVDKYITDQTASLLYRLQQIRGGGVWLGQHDGLWIKENGQLDSYFSHLTGKLPAIASFDYMFITRRDNGKGSWTYLQENEIRRKIIAAHEAGIAITMCWHYNDPYTGSTFYAKEIPDCRLRQKSFRSILPGQENHEQFKKDLQKVAEFAHSLRDKNDQEIPFIFRPFHEFDGNWFWWGAKYNTPEEFKTVWRFMVNYLKDSLNVHNMLYAFSPDIKFDSKEEYLLRYPGDTYVDILGLDDYKDFKYDERRTEKAKERIRILGQLAAEKHKPCALTELGYFVKKNKTGKRDLERIRSMLNVLSEMNINLSYIAFWSNGSNNYCVPQPGNTGEKEFTDFLKQPFVLMAGDQPNPVRLALLPDIQTYTQSYPEIALAQTQWLADHKEDFHFVLQQGDITDWNAPEQWEVARKVFSCLDGKIPYTFVPGNHDMGNCADIRNTDLFNCYLPYEKYSRMTGFGGAFETGKMDNTWHSFKAAGVDWIILSLEFATRNCVLDWAEKIIMEHPQHKIIINTHDYMYSDNTRMGKGDDWLPQSYGVGKESGENTVNDGEQMWKKLVSQYENIFIVLSGHVLHSGTGRLVSKGVHGNKVYQMLANYQLGVDDVNEGKSGFMRILTIDVKNKTIDVKTYSPYTDQYKTDINQQFRFEDIFF